jgi:hypothetical protein
MQCWFFIALAALITTATAAAADDTRAADPFNPLLIKWGGSAGTDYIDRGTTLSAHRPSVGGFADVQAGDLYVRGEINSVKLPSAPIAEINIGGGVRHTFGPLRIDLNAMLSHYPHEILDGRPTDTDFWESTFEWFYEVKRGFELNGQLAWAPNIGKTGAWSDYAEMGFSVALPAPAILRDVVPYFSSGFGRYWFGHVTPATGGYRLPAHNYLHAGIELVRAPYSLDLRFHDTSLSKESCFVFTGDPTATLGGTVDAISNPKGLQSDWCGAAFVATLTVEMESKLSNSMASARTTSP